MRFNNTSFYVRSCEKINYTQVEIKKYNKYVLVIAVQAMP